MGLAGITTGGLFVGRCKTTDPVQLCILVKMDF
jgi:hypothetical protein